MFFATFFSESQYQCVKQALHTAVPERLLSRETERGVIVSFLEKHVVPGKPSSLYISGAPGTGKSACLNCVLQERKVGFKNGSQKGYGIDTCLYKATLARYIKKNSVAGFSGFAKRSADCGD